MLIEVRGQKYDSMHKAEFRGAGEAVAPSRLALAPLGSETEIIYKCAIARFNVEEKFKPPYILKTFDSPPLPPFSGFSPDAYTLIHQN